MHDEAKNVLNYDEYVEDYRGEKFGIVKTKFTDTAKDRILIEIASYRDALLVSTVKSAATQADYPERICFAISYQYEDLGPLHELESVDNCKIIHIPLDRADGACNARNLCQRLVTDEKYVMHVDPHMRFIKHWDTALIDFLESKHDPKGFISGYPYGVSDEECLLPVDDSLFDTPPDMPLMRVRNFRTINGSNACLNTLYSQLTYTAVEYWNNVKCDRQPMIGACYFFGYADIDKTVKVDPYMWLYGDEFPVSLRLFTHGFNNYRFNKCYALHKWSHTQRFYQGVAMQRIYDEDDRIGRLMDGTLEGEYGLGSIRTVKEYEDFIGVEFATKLIKKHGQCGDFGKDAKREDRQPVFSALLASKCYVKQKSFRLRVLVFDVDGHAGDCVNNLKATAGESASLDICVISGKDAAFSDDIDIVHCSEKSFSDFFWSAFDDKFAENYADYHVMCVLSNMRFADGWYAYYSDLASSLSDRDIVTSSVVNYVISRFTKGYMPCKLTYHGSTYMFESRAFNISTSPVCQDFAAYTGAKNHPCLMNCFLLCKSSVFAGLLRDTNVSFYDFLFVMSARLFTLGYNLFYGNRSYVYYQGFIDNFDYVFNKSDSNKVNGIMGVSEHASTWREDALDRDTIANMNPAELRSMIAFYFNCGFDFNKMVSL